MGIRFYCPNGHKLNVKSFQAGKMGVCPHCGAKIQIPTESTRPSSAKTTENEPVQPEMPLSNIPIGTPVDVAPDAEIPTGTLPPSEIPVDQTLDPTATPAPPSAPDPLVEAPNAVWYVRLASGDQFGPAASNVMSEWLLEGRVTPDSLVWREGWRDWLKASDIFPQLSDFEQPTGLAAIPITTISRTAAKYRTTRRHSSKQNTFIIITLILVLAVLAAILSWVLSNT